MMNDPHLWLWPALAYLLGAVPSGRVVARLSAGIDVTRAGSGNIGATNVARTAGPLAGLVTLLADAAKGALPVWLARQVVTVPGEGDLFWGALVLAAVLGHLFPVYTRGRGGGKGVATAAGGFAPLVPQAVLLSLAVFAAVLLVTRRVSPASLAAAGMLPVMVLCGGSGWALVLAAAAAGGLIVWRHRENIVRLRRGTEPPVWGSRR